ncbi:MAG: hypothetical protein OHK0023_19650 [Anaerolineae bacterium]
MFNRNLVGQTLGQYELRELLGRGGMAEVYLGYQPVLKRFVAVKVLPQQFNMEEGYLERFRREAEIAAGLDHPYIVTIFDFGSQGGINYMVMRLLNGGTLAERIRERRSTNQHLALAEIADLLSKIGGALDYAHKRNIIHRDIKPSNIMFDEQGTPFLVDFGIAKPLDAASQMTAVGTSMGTVAYMSPEQWRGEKVLTPKVDQYALGMMVYLLVTGKMPFDVPADNPYALMHRHLNEFPLPAHSVREGVPPSITQIIERAIAKRPEDRYPTVGEMAKEFEQAVERAGEKERTTGFFTFPLSPKPPVDVTAPGLPMAPGGYSPPSTPPAYPPPAPAYQPPPQQRQEDVGLTSPMPAALPPQQQNPGWAKDSFIGLQQQMGYVPSPSPKRVSQLGTPPVEGKSAGGGRRGLIAVFAGIIVVAVIAVVLLIASSGQTPAAVGDAQQTETAVVMMIEGSATALAQTMRGTIAGDELLATASSVAQTAAAGLAGPLSETATAAAGLAGPLSETATAAALTLVAVPTQGSGLVIATAVPTEGATSAPTEASTSESTLAPTNAPTEVVALAGTPAASEVPTDSALTAETPTPTPEATQVATSSDETPDSTVTETAAPTATSGGGGLQVVATETPTLTPTLDATATFTPSNTPTATPTATPTSTPTETNTPTNTPTSTPTATATNTPTNTPTPTSTPTNTPTETSTPTPTETPLPPPPTIFGPTGDYGDRTPDYTWFPVTGATEYILKTPDGQETRIKADDTTICKPDVCRVPSETLLDLDASFTWSVFAVYGDSQPIGAEATFKVVRKGDTIGVYQPTEKRFVLRASNAEQENRLILLSFPEILDGDLPFTGDWDGDGIDTVGVYRPATQEFLLWNENRPDASLYRQFRVEADIAANANVKPLAGDFNGDGLDGVVIVVVSNVRFDFFIRETLESGPQELILRLNTPARGTPVIGDFDGSGKDSLAGYFIVGNTAQFRFTNDLECAGEDCVFNTPPNNRFQYGSPQDDAESLPLAGDWVNSGQTGLGIRRPVTSGDGASGLFLLINVAAEGLPNTFVGFGSPTDIPIAGTWQP